MSTPAATSAGAAVDGVPRVIAFFLPQFHPIPENDAWWGAGFTEWTNVAAARPLFPGHHQPHIPADLGFYDLRLAETREAQAALARDHGVSAFCWYHYWFNGRTLLERPFQEVLRSGRPDLPFCLCWANENWTRRWDGLDREVLVAQDYAAYDAEAHLRHLAHAFADPRYLTVDGRPLYLVYRPDAIPQVARVVDAWREAALRLGIADPFLVAVRSSPEAMDHAAARQAGFDGCCEFYPNQWNRADDPFAARQASRARRTAFSAASRLSSWAALRRPPRPAVWSYPQLVRYALDRPGECFPCVTPGWDNSARRRRGATIIQNDDPGLYGAWLEAALHRARASRGGQGLVFVNAWNEWAEGCHLEPDRRHGRAFLQATADAVARVAADGAAAPRPAGPGGRSLPRPVAG